MRTTLFATLFASVLLLAGVSAAAAADTTVMIKNFSFDMDVTVTPGSTVTWKNLDGEPHTVVSADGLFRSPALDQNDSFSFKFDKPGTFKYICSIHPRMRALVTVK
jgi:plastocyanin